MNYKLLKLIIVVAITAYTFHSCKRSGTGDRMDVMVVWATDDTDPTYQRWTPMVDEAIQELADTVVLHPAYIKLGKQRRIQSVEEFRTIVQNLAKENHKPRLILLHGAYSEMMFWDSQKDSIFKDIPIVAFGLHINSFSIPEIEAHRNAGVNSHPRYAEIFDTLALKENLDMAARIFPHRKRFVSCLDRWSRFVDICQMSLLYKQCAHWDTTRYINNMDLHITHDSLPRVNDRIVFQTLAHLYPESNIQPADSTIFPVKWAFNSHRDCMHFIQLNHDDVTRHITENADRTPYMTMTAEDFLVNDSCIGGYFAPFETQISDAVQAARELLAFKDDTLRLVRHHKKEYQMNWNAIRNTLTPEEDGVESIYFHPADMEGVNLYNVNILDYYPEHKKLIKGIISFIIFLILCTIVWICIKAYRKHKHMVSKARHTAHLAEVEQTMNKSILTATDSFEWKQDDHVFDAPHFYVNQYFRKKLTDFLAISTPGTYELQLPASIDDRERQWYHIVMLVEKTKHGGLRRSGFAVNINTVKKMETEFLDADRMLKVAKERESFLASMSYQIRTPLNAIVGFSQLVGSPDMDFSQERLAEFHEIIIDNNVILTRIINDMLTHTLMGNSNMRLNMTAVSIGEFMKQDNLWDYANHTLTRQNTQLVVETDGPDAIMMCDTLSLTSVLNNLVDNAAKFSPAGSSVNVSWTVDDDYVTISVRDKGMGISEENLKSVFEHFFKVDTYRPGTGLGLSLCRNWMELMGGSIGVESKLGEGSCFWIKIQRKQ